MNEKMSKLCCQKSYHNKSTDSIYDEIEKLTKLEKEAKKQSKLIDKELKRSGRIFKETIKLLLLGTGESGKSTVLKQMRIIHTLAKFSQDEKREKIFYIKSNLKDSILSILDAMERFSITFDDAANLNETKDFVYENIDLILLENNDNTFNNYEIQIEKLWDSLENLWNDNGFKKCTKFGNKYHLIDSYEYFLNRLNIIRQKDYLPSDQDILRCRVLTRGILETHFHVNNVKFHVFDVGGQRDQRRKWIECFNEVTAIIFVADLSSFDLTMREDSKINRLRESLETFRQIWNNRYLKNVSIILFLNKYDILVKKIVEENSRLEDYFPNYVYFKTPTHIEQNFCIFGENPAVTRAKMFILDQFLLITIRSKDLSNKKGEDDFNNNNNYSKFCIPYFTCAVDTDNIKKVFKACSHILKKEHLEKCGLI